MVQFIGVRHKKQEFPNTLSLVAENSYRILQSANEFQNGKNIFCDEFTTANGINGTINSSETNSIYDNTNLLYNCIENKSNSLVIGQNYSSMNGTITTTGTIKKKGFFKSRTIVASSSNDTARLTIEKNGIEIYNHQINLQYSGSTYSFDLENGINEYFEVGDEYKMVLYSSAGRTTGSQTNINNDYITMISNTNNDFYGVLNFQVDATYNETLIICDNNTIDIKDTDKNLCVFVDADIPNGCDILYDISDSVTGSITDLKPNENVDVSSLGTGTAKITFKLKSNGVDTPVLRGYGAIVVR